MIQNIEQTEQSIQLQLFYPKASNEKVHYKVMYKMYKELYDHKVKFIEFSKQTEIKTTAKPFATMSGAEKFVKLVAMHLKGYAGWYKILEYK